jgi:hypothetical protein
MYSIVTAPPNAEGPRCGPSAFLNSAGIEPIGFDQRRAMHVAQDAGAQRTAVPSDARDEAVAEATRQPNISKIVASAREGRVKTGLTSANPETARRVCRWRNGNAEG